MREKTEGLTITQLIFNGTIFCLYGWFIFVLIEILIRLIKGPLLPWTFTFMTLPWTFMIFLFALLLYIVVGIIVGGVLGGGFALLLKVVKRWQKRIKTLPFIMACCITIIVLLYTSLFIHDRFLPLYPTLHRILISLAFIPLSLILLSILYMILARIIDKTKLIASYLALSITLYTFMIGGLYINENLLAGKFFNPDYVRVIINLGILISCIIIYMLIYPIFIFIGKKYKKTFKFTIKTLIVILIVSVVIGVATYFIGTRSTLEKYIVKPSIQTDDKPNIILITMDTTRADHLSCYGYHKNTTPYLDKLASESVVFKNVYATAPWTLPSHASIFTGMYPARHGAHYAWVTTKIVSPTVLGKHYKTLAEILVDDGYRTAGIVGGPVCKSFLGLAQGFEYYDDAFINIIPDLEYFSLFKILSRWVSLKDSAARQGLNGYRVASQINTRVFSWLEKCYQSPFFLFINYFDPHHPYHPPERFSHLFGRDENYDLLSQYDGEIAYLDYHLGKLFEKLKELKIYDNTMIIITSDHGEFFGEHNFWRHGCGLYEELLKIPLIIKYPSHYHKKGVYSKRVSLVDITPTILNFLGLPIPKRIQGVNLFEGNSKVMAELYEHRSFGGRLISGSRSLYIDNYKYIKGKEGKGELYDIVEDPRELHNLINTIPKKAEEMESKLVDWLSYDESQISKKEFPKFDEATEKSLRALEYIQ